MGPGGVGFVLRRWAMLAMGTRPSLLLMLLRAIGRGSLGIMRLMHWAILRQDIILN